MNCPVCQAKLMPVDGQMFCLQCGEVSAIQAGVDSAGPVLEETTDPVLQRAIVDAVQHDVQFRLPVSDVLPPAPKTSAFTSMRSVLEAPRPALAGGLAAPALPVVVAPVAQAEPAAQPTPVARPPEPEPVVRAVVAAGVEATSALNLLPDRAKRRVAWRWPKALGVWSVASLVFVLFVSLNVGLHSYYSNRVYPGVKVGGVALGGLPLSELESKLAQVVAQPKLSVAVGSGMYELDTRELGSADLERVVADVREVGRSTPLPLAGVVRALVSPPVAVRREVNDKALKLMAAQVVANVNHSSSDALPLIVKGRAVVIAEKAGAQLDANKVAESIRLAYGNKDSLMLVPSKAEPVVTAASYRADIEEAQAKLGLNLQVKRRSVMYKPTAEQLGGWLVFNGPGKGVAVDGAQVAAYVATIPGRFDRVAATDAVIAAVNNKQDLNYAVSTRKVTATPKLAGILPALPVRMYGYCVQPAGDSGQELADRAAVVLSGASGWSLGGRLKFERVETGCNFTLSLRPTGAMGELSSGCKGQRSCTVANVLALELAAWLKAPAGWTGTLDAYRDEMITHEVGHWLGFNRASCLSKDTPMPILDAPALTLDGCSPNWYAIPVENQGTKVLLGF